MAIGEGDFTDFADGDLGIAGENSLKNEDEMTGALYFTVQTTMAASEKFALFGTDHDEKIIAGHYPPPPNFGRTPYWSTPDSPPH
jgi:hypothetical protein